MEESMGQHNVDGKTEESSKLPQPSSTSQLVNKVRQENDRSNKRKKKKGNKRKNREETGEIEEDDTKFKKPPPNYFLSVQVNSPQIKGGFKAVQDSIVSHDKRLKQTIVNVKTSHLTLFILTLQSEEDVEEACTLLESCKEDIRKILNDEPLMLRISSLGHFSGKVLFAKLVEGEDADKLKEIAEFLINKFEKFRSSNRFDYKPHVTLMKLSKAPRMGKKIRKIDNAYYDHLVGIEFGTEPARTVQLLSMFKKKQKDGYYQCECEIPFSVAKENEEESKCEIESSVPSKNTVENFSQFMSSYCTLSAYCTLMANRKTSKTSSGNSANEQVRSPEAEVILKKR